MNKKIIRSALFVTICMAMLFISIYAAIAEPSGATIQYNATVTGQGRSADNRTDPRGTVTTLVLYGVQQDQHWKAYVGNVTGKLTLDDGDAYTIYDWDLTGLTINGEVYAARVSSPDFSSVSCADVANITAEETFHNMSASEKDSISSTFNYTLHDQVYVGTLSIAQNNCPSTATYLNSTRQAMSNPASVYFQELILMDANYDILYTTIIEDDVNGYRDENTTTYDFQMIVPESDIKSSPTTYYFFTEIES